MRDSVRTMGSRRVQRARQVALSSVVLAFASVPATAQQFEDDKWFEEADRSLDDIFGFALDSTLKHAVVGEPGGDALGQGPFNVGKAHVFTHTADGWVYSKLLAASDGAQSDLFGMSVAIDGDTLMAGTWRHAGAVSQSGAVYVFEFRDGLWLETQEILGDEGDRVGVTLALDGGRALAGTLGVGSAYVLERTDFGWTRVAELAPPAGLLIAPRVALDGDVAVLGMGSTWGEAFVYERQDDGSWSQVAHLTDPTPNTGDHFGSSVAVEGEFLAVGELASDLVAPRTGSVFVYERLAGVWTQVKELKASTGEVYGPPGSQSGDKFGTSLAINRGRIFAGAPNNREAGDHMGSVHCFERKPKGKWFETDRYLPGDTSVPGLFGSALSATEGTLLVGAHAALAGPPDDEVPAGAVYLYDLPLGEIYCDGEPNSLGVSATLQATGSPSAAVGDLLLTASDLPPDRFGFFLASPAQGFVDNPAGSQGTLCLGAPMARMPKQVVNSGPAGRFSIQVDTVAIPMGPPVAIQPGETWNFQAWYRDENPRSTTNLSAALAVTFR